MARRPQCDDCGATTTELTCGELFDQLLALDHSRRQPWGALHGEAVACYFLQHPNAPRAPRVAALLYERLERFIDPDPDPDRESSLHPTTVTIHDVALDGAFPAAGYRQRLDRWARSILDSRSSE